MKETSIKSLLGYIEEVCRINNSLESNGANKNEILLFRGHSDNSYELIPAIGRNKPFATNISIFDEEQNLIE